MAEIEVTGTIPAPIADVWAVAGDFGRVADWVPALAGSELGAGSDGSSVGDTRQCQIEGGPALAEAQTARSDADYTYSYAITESPLPLSNYASTIRLEADGDQTTLVWSASFDPDPGAEEATTSMINGVYEAGLATLQQRFGG